MATIGLNANPMRAELATVQKLAAQAGVNMQNSLSGGHHSGSSGIIRESLVLMRETAAGNWSKVPGSFSLLLQQIGVLKYILKDASQASTVVADAMRKQAVAALEAAAAVREEASAVKAAAVQAIAKAEASKAVAIADSMAKAEAGTAASALGLEGAAYANATATITAKSAASEAAYTADLQEADAAIVNATANEAEATAANEAAAAMTKKAVAASEAAAAENAAGASSVATGGIIAGIFIAIAAGAYLAYKQIQAVKEVMSGLKPVDFDPEYIAKHLKAGNANAEAQKEINKEIEKSVELHNSAAKSAERAAQVSKAHFEHLRKMNGFERDPRKKIVRGFEIAKQERDDDLGKQITAKANLEMEGKAKQAKAAAIRVSSKEEDANLLALRKKEAESAKEFLKHNGDFGEKFTRARAAIAIGSVGDVNAANDKNAAEAHAKIKAYESTVDDVAARDEIRKKKDTLNKQAGEALSKAADSTDEIDEQKKRNALADKNAKAEVRAELDNKIPNVGKLDLNEHQKIGAYSSLNSSNMETQMLRTAELSEQHLKEIKTLLNQPKMTTSGVQY